LPGLICHPRHFFGSVRFGGNNKIAKKEKRRYEADLLFFSRKFHNMEGPLSRGKTHIFGTSAGFVGREGKRLIPGSFVQSLTSSRDSRTQRDGPEGREVTTGERGRNMDQNASPFICRIGCRRTPNGPNATKKLLRDRSIRRFNGLQRSTEGRTGRERRM